MEQSTNSEFKTENPHYLCGLALWPVHEQQTTKQGTVKKWAGYHVGSMGKEEDTNVPA